MTTVNLTANTNDVIQQLEKINATLLTMSDNSKKTSKDTADAAKEATNKWTELNAKIEVFNKVIQGGLGYLTHFKDTILEMEGFQTQATALSLLSKEGENLNDVLKQSLEITKGVVNEYDLLAVTNKLMMKGFNLSEEALAKLIDVSATYSSTTGEAVASVMEKIAQASQRERDSLFEKMGVYIKTKDVLDTYAKSIGTTAEKLDEATKSSVLLDAATTAMKEKFDDLGLSAASLESPITHTFKRAETAMTQAKDVAVGLAASIYVDLVNSFEYLFLKASGMTNEALWKIQDESDAKNIMAALTSEMNKLVSDEADKLVKFSKLPFQEQEKLREQSSKDTEEFAAKQEELLNKVQALKDQVGVGALGDAYGFISQDTANLIQKLESDVAKIGTKAVQKSEMIKAMAKETQTSWVNFADLPEEKKGHAAKVDPVKSIVDSMKNSSEEAKTVYSDALKAMGDFNKGVIESTKLTKEEELAQTLADDKLKYELIKMNMDNEARIIEDGLQNQRKIMEKDAAEKEKIKQMSYNVLNEAANEFYNSVISGEEDLLQRVAAIALQTAGSNIFADGLERIWKGGGDMLKFSNPVKQAEGSEQFAYGLAEVAGGLALGYVGQQMMPSASEGTSKSTAAEDRNKFGSENQASMNVYLYPDEKHYLRTLNKSFAKIGGQK